MRWFGRHQRQTPPVPTQSVANATASIAAPDEPVLPASAQGLLDVARDVRARIRADRRDVREVAGLVVAEIQSEPYDIYWTHAEMRAWIGRAAAVHGIDLEFIRPAHLIEAIKGHPAVTYYEKRIRDDQRFEALRRRLVLARGAVPQKCWIFEVADNGRVMADAPERISPVVRDAFFAAEAQRRASSVRPDAPTPGRLRSPAELGRSPGVQSGFAAGVRGGVVPELPPESGAESRVFTGVSDAPAGLSAGSGVPGQKIRFASG